MDEKESILRETWLAAYTAALADNDEDHAAEMADRAMVPVLDRLEEGFAERARAVKHEQLEEAWVDPEQELVGHVAPAPTATLPPLPPRDYDALRDKLSEIIAKAMK